MKLRSTWVTVILSLLMFFVMALIPSEHQIVQAQMQKLPVFVDYSGDDSIGTNTVFQFKEAIRRSASYELVTRSEDAGITVSIISTEVDASTRSVLSMVAITGYIGCVAGRKHESYSILLHNIYTVGRERSLQSGNNLLPDLDKAWDDARRRWKQEFKQEGCGS